MRISKSNKCAARLHGALMRAIQAIETVKAGSMEHEALVRLSGLQARVTNSAQAVGEVGRGSSPCRRSCCC